jgi:type I restriction enzyme S subunit
MINNNIPKHWKIKILSEIGKCVTGTTPPKNDPRNYGNDIPFVKPPQLFDNQISNAPEKLSKRGAELARIIPVNSVLVTCIGNLGRTAINTIPVTFNQQINAIIPFDKIEGRFLFYQAQSYNFRKQLDELSSATTVAIVNKGKFETIEIVIPPILEQLAIVSRIEELLSDLENGKQQLLTAQQQLKIYRQSLLNTIVSKENCKSIESVIEKLDQGWSPKCLNEPSTNDNEWAVIKTTAVQNGHFDCIENKILPSNLKPREQHELKIGDILITRAGPRIRVGVCCMVRKTRPNLINCDKVYRIKVKTNIIRPEYFELIVNTPFYQREIEKMKSGISDSGLNLTQAKFLKIEIPIPPLLEQQLIVDELESKLTVCDKIEETISQSLLQAESLRQSILKKAFEGKLVKHQ